MIVRATATKAGFQKGVEYDLSEDQARAAITAGLAVFVAVAPNKQREKAVMPKYETR